MRIGVQCSLRVENQLRRLGADQFDPGGDWTYELRGTGFVFDRRGRLNVPRMTLDLLKTIADTLVEERKDFAKARVVEVLDPSPDRVEPPCPHVARGCGGCDLQHVRAEAQPALKRAIVVDALPDPGLELVGVIVSQAAKVGRDAGELCGGPRVGVAATDDIAGAASI